VKLLTLNTGSSSLKFALYEIRPGDAGVDAAEGMELLDHGTIDRVGDSQAGLQMAHGGGGSDAASAAISTREAVLRSLIAKLDRSGVWKEVAAVGHRFVHGGSTYREPVLVTPAVRNSLEQLVPLAPAHLPGELAALDLIARERPSLPQVACFDTAFHAGMPREARLFGIPRRFADEGVVRYGFHGLSYEYVTTALAERGQLGARTIVAHLGNGASMAAIANGKSIDTTMGFTPVGGFVMSTRSGDIDPGVLLYLLAEWRLPVEEVSALVRVTGGLLGLSETASDMRDLLARTPSDERAAEAVAVFCYQIRKCIGAYVAALRGLDTLVFTGGIGENSPEIRARICDSLDCFGVRLEPEANAAGEGIISPARSPVTVHVVRTDEESVIARQTRRVLLRSAPVRPGADPGVPH
jgi:acetate kinase